MDLDDFCEGLSRVADFKTIDYAIAIIWWNQTYAPEKPLSAGRIARIVLDHNLANPNSSRLRQLLKGDSRTRSANGTFRLKPIAYREEGVTLAALLDQPAPAEPRQDDYLTSSLWHGCPPYIGQIGNQLNGTVRAGYYDAAAVMLRRLVETLIIEAYEAAGRASDIEDEDHNYLPLAAMIKRIETPATRLVLGRDSRRALPAIKRLGDKSAHNRRFIARRPDLSKQGDDARVVVEELVALMRHPTGGLRK